MDSTKYNIKYAVLTLFIVICHSLSAQDKYTGKRAEMYQQRAYSFMQTFYSLITDMSFEKELFETYLLSVKDNLVAPQAVFIPDYTIQPNKSNITTLNHYIIKFKEIYSPYLDKIEGQLNFRLSSPTYLTMTYTSDRLGVEVNFQYALEIFSNEKCLYKGKSQAVVVFPDIVDIANSKVKQISFVSGSIMYNDSFKQQTANVELGTNYVMTTDKMGTSENQEDSIPGYSLFIRISDLLSDSANFKSNSLVTDSMAYYHLSLENKYIYVYPSDMSTYEGSCLFFYETLVPKQTRYMGCGHFTPAKYINQRTIMTSPQQIDSLYIEYDDGISLYQTRDIMKSKIQHLFHVRLKNGTVKEFYSEADVHMFRDCTAQMHDKQFGNILGRFKDFEPVKGEYYRIITDEHTSTIFLYPKNINELPVTCTIEKYDPSTGRLLLAKSNFNKNKTAPLPNAQWENPNYYIKIPNHDKNNIPELTVYCVDENGAKYNYTYKLNRFNHEVKEVDLSSFQDNIVNCSVNYFTNGKRMRASKRFPKNVNKIL